MKKLAARAASLNDVKFQAVTQSAVRAASPQGGRASGRLDHGACFALVGRASVNKNRQHIGLNE